MSFYFPVAYSSSYIVNKSFCPITSEDRACSLIIKTHLKVKVSVWTTVSHIQERKWAASVSGKDVSCKMKSWWRVWVQTDGSYHPSLISPCYLQQAASVLTAPIGHVGESFLPAHILGADRSRLVKVVLKSWMISHDASHFYNLECLGAFQIL